MEKPNSPYCDCGAGYRGDKCEFDLCNELINPCVHGNCTHSPDYPYRMECICDPDWTGMASDKKYRFGILFFIFYSFWDAFPNASRAIL